MKFKCPLIVVSDIGISRNFYKKVLKQKVKFDFGENLVFEGGFSIQFKPHFADMIGINQDEIAIKSNNFELYFEEDNLESFIERLNAEQEIQYLHSLIEHPWGQRVIRFYDPDMYIIEDGENMEAVARRFLSQGLSVEETAGRTQHPVEFVRQLL